MIALGRRAGALVLMAMLGAATLPGCKRTVAPKVEEVWDEEPAVGEAEALAALAPPWGAPTHAVLDSGLVTFWLHEPDAPATHVRVLLPMDGDPETSSAAVMAVLQAYLQSALDGRARNLAMAVDGRLAPDRVELTVHASVDDTAAALRTVGMILGARAPAAGLETARAEVAAQLPAKPSSDELATSTLAAMLLSRPLATQRATRAEVEALTRDELLEAWEALVDPRRVILVVHSGDAASVHRGELRSLAERWRGMGRRPVPPSSVARLRPWPTPPSGSGHLLAEPATALQVLAGPGDKPLLVLGRVVPTPRPEDRSLARLAQRLLQEELDARLVIHGDYAVFMVRVSLSGREPERSASEAIDALSQLAQQRQPQQRLFQAAQLWLGARVVQASLDGEDWTALWSESMDLATGDPSIAGALARDASTMLQPDPEAFGAWMRTWFDPRGGQPGWQWLVVGASEADVARLRRIAPVQAVAATPAGG